MIAVWMYRQYIFIRYITFRQIRPDASAVDEGDVSARYLTVGVGAEISQIRLPVP